MACPTRTVMRGADGRPWLRLDYTRGQCDDHWLPNGSWDGPMGWESDRRPRPVPVASKPRLRGLDEFPGFTESCDLPTLSGLGLYAAAGAVANRRRRARGALDGLWGGWVGCAVARAIGAGSSVSRVLTIGGAYLVAKTFSD